MAARAVRREREQLDGPLLAFLERLHLGASALNAALLENGRLPLFDGVQCVEEARRGQAQRGGRFAGGPDVNQPVQGVLALLNALFVAHRAGLGALGSAKAAALVADDRLDGREQLGRRHYAHWHAGAAEDRLDNLAVVPVGDDDAVLHGVAAHDAAGRHLQVEDGVAGGGKLVNQLLGRSPMVEDALVGLLQDDDATAFDALVVADHGGGDEVGEGDVGDEAAALVDLQPGLFALLPLGHAHLAAQHAGIDAHVGDGFGQDKGSAPGLAVFARLRRSGEALVAENLLRCPALVDRRQSQKTGQTGGRRSAVHPG